MKRIKGAGGGGGGGGAAPPIEAPNTLRSRAILTAIELLGEGPIEGFVDSTDPAKNMYLNNVVLQNQDGSFNFKNVKFEYRLGLPYASQSHLPNFSQQETQFGVSTNVLQASPVLRTLTPGTDRVRVTVVVPQLTHFKENGSLYGSRVEYEIEYQLTGAGDWFRGQTNEQERTFNNLITPATAGIHRIVFSTGVHFTSVSSSCNWTRFIQYREYPSGGWLTLVNDSGSVRGYWNVETTDAGSGDQIETGGWAIPDGYRAPFDTGDDFFDPAKQYEFRDNSGFVNENIGSYQAYGEMSQVIAGKNVSPYYRAMEFDLPVPASTYDIRVRRVSNDQIDTKTKNDIDFHTYTEIISEKLSYPDSVVVGVSINSEGFDGKIPKRAYLVKGLQVQIPDNYDPLTRVYTGMWGGSYDTEWTDNPAWVLLDLLVNPRYGLGEVLDIADVDTAALYTISQYNDELVHKGEATLTAGAFIVGEDYEIVTTGTTDFTLIGAADSDPGTQFRATGIGTGTGTAFAVEPRFTFNSILAAQEDVYHTLNAVASSMRVMIYWAAGSVTFVQDAPRVPDKIVSRGNVIEGAFSYESISLRARHNVVLVTWNDPSNLYLPAVEVVELPDQITKFGWNQTEIRAVGCTSRGQAHRLGRWLLYTEQYESEMVSYRAAFDHMGVVPGMVIDVHDNHYAGSDFGGRVVSAVVVSTEHEIVLDREIILAPATTYTLGMLMPDGTVEYQDITTAASTTDTVRVPLYSQLPVANAMWGISSSVLAPRKFRVLSTEEIEPGIWEIGGLLHFDGKYALVEDGTVFDLLPSTLIDYSPPGEVTELTITERIALVADVAMAIITLSWVPPVDSRDLTFQIHYKLQPTDYDSDEDTWLDWEMLTTSLNTVEIFDVEPGLYVFSVATIGQAQDANVRSQDVIVPDFQIVGKSAPPAVPAGFAAGENRGTLSLVWEEIADLDLMGYVIRFHEQGTPNWDAGVLLTNTTRTTYFITNSVPPGDWTFLIKAKDTSGNLSIGYASIDETMTQHNVIVSEVIHEPDWDSDGALTNFVLHHTGVLVPQSTKLMKDYIVKENWEKYAADAYATSIFEADEVELITAGSVRLFTTIGAAPGPSETGEPIYLVEVNIDPDGTGYTGWQTHIPGLYIVKKAKFRITFTNTEGFRVVVSALHTVIDEETIQQRQKGVAIGSSGTTITFSPAFNVIPIVTPTPKTSGATGQIATVDDVTETDALITVYNANTGAKEAGDVDVLISNN